MIYVQQALSTYIAAKRQVRYRRTLMAEAERDLKNKTTDFEIADEAAAAALSNLVAACEEAKA